MNPKVAVILFPGSNCELEAVRSSRQSGMETEIFRWNDESSKLKKFDAYILPGGFSYEDRGRSGIIASKDPIMEMIRKESSKGKPVLGICNGAQILVESGLIPGLTPDQLEMALAWNERIKQGKILGVGFYNDWIYIRHDVRSGRSVYNRFGKDVIMRIPVAHGEGRFTSREQNLLDNLIKNEQTLFRYCDRSGKFSNEFPVNPNGAVFNLAGVCNPEGHILALMPHPERTIHGKPIFDSLADYLKSGSKTAIRKPQKIAKIKPVRDHMEQQKQKPDIVILVRLIITDNEERTLENTIKQLGYKDVTLYRQVYLGFHLQNRKNLEKTARKLIESGEILNLNKEIPTILIGKQAYSYEKKKGLNKIKNPTPGGFHFIAMEYDNYAGKNIYANLQNHFPEKTLEKVERGISWIIRTKNVHTAGKVIQTHIFHNPHSMEIITV